MEEHHNFELPPEVVPPSDQEIDDYMVNVVGFRVGVALMVASVLAVSIGEMTGCGEAKYRSYAISQMQP